MAEHHYIVSNNGGIWQFSALGSTFAHFGSRDEAVDAAIEAAREAGEPEAQVIVQDMNREQQTVWRAGQGS